MISFGTVGSGAVAPDPVDAVLSQAVSMSVRYGAMPAVGTPCWASAHCTSELVLSRSAATVEPSNACARSVPSSASWTAICRPLCWLVIEMLATKNADRAVITMVSTVIATSTSISVKPLSGPGRVARRTRPGARCRPPARMRPPDLLRRDDPAR